MNCIGQHKNDLLVVGAVWLGLSALLVGWTIRLAAVPILYYDEALAAGMAKDFVENQHRSERFPGTATVEWFGRPAPTFLQGYIGALKPWMLVPSFELCGPTLNTIRWTDLGWGLVSLLFFMLFAWRLRGRWVGLLAGVLLAVDPAYYFANLYDWGPTTPSFLCRMAGFFLFLVWWQRRRPITLFLAGLVFGLGFYAKLDFVLILAGTGLALWLTQASEINRVIRRAWRQLVVGGVGFVLGASPTLLNMPEIIRRILGGEAAGDADERMEKLHTFWTMFDGSYFYRLMAHGGDFKRMFNGPAGVWSPWGVVLGLALVVVGILAVRSWRRRDGGRLPAFLVLSTALVLLETWLLPSAIRIHHWTLAYPFPHLIMALAAVQLWDKPPGRAFWRPAVRGAVAVAMAGVLIGQLLAIQKTGGLICETGGRGLWSSALSRFAEEVKHRSDLTIVSLDWGFNEPLKFLTDGPRLAEPIWQLQAGGKFPISRSSNVIYLVHPRESTLFPYGRELLGLAYSTDPRKVSIQPWQDRQGETAFLAIRFLGE